MIHLDNIRSPKLPSAYIIKAPTDLYTEKSLHMIVLLAKYWIAIYWRVKKKNPTNSYCIVRELCCLCIFGFNIPCFYTIDPSLWWPIKLFLWYGKQLLAFTIFRVRPHKHYF